MQRFCQPFRVSAQAGGTSITAVARVQHDSFDYTPERELAHLLSQQLALLRVVEAEIVHVFRHVFPSEASKG